MIDTPPLVDQYCHGVLRTELGLGTFETALGRTGTLPAPGTTFFDTQTGFAVRRWCPPLLGSRTALPAGPLSGPPPRAGRPRSRADGCCAAPGSPPIWWTPGCPATSPRPHEIAAAGAADAHEIVRLELLAEQVADTSGTVDVLPRQPRRGRAHRGRAPPSPSPAVAGAARRTRPASRRGPGRCAARPGGGSRAGADTARLDDPVLLRHLLWNAVATGRPLQLQLGMADPMPLGRVRGRDGRARHRSGAAARLSVPPSGRPSGRRPSACVRRRQGRPWSARGRGPRPSSRRSWSWPRSGSCSTPAGPGAARTACGGRPAVLGGAGPGAGRLGRPTARGRAGTRGGSRG